MHLLCSNFKKQANSFPLRNSFMCSCFYNNMHVLVAALNTTVTKFSPDKDIHNIDRYWSQLVCYIIPYLKFIQSVFMPLSSIQHRVWTIQVVIYRLNIGRKKTWRYIPPSIHFRKNPIFDTVNLRNTKILCIFNVKLSTFPSDHLALHVFMTLWISDE